MIVFLHICQIFSAIAVIVLVLMQRGKGAEMGAAFGSGASGSLFGATGSANFLTKSTAVLATIFFVSTLAIAYFARYDYDVKNPGVSSLEQALEQQNKVETKPAAVEQSTLPLQDNTQPPADSAAAAKPAETKPVENKPAAAAPVEAKPTASQPPAAAVTGAAEPNTTPPAQ